MSVAWRSGPPKQECRWGRHEVYNFCSCYAHIVVVLCYTIFAATSYHGNPTAAREVNLVEETIITSFVVGIASSLVAAWLYDRIRERGKH